MVGVTLTVGGSGLRSIAVLELVRFLTVVDAVASWSGSAVTYENSVSGTPLGDGLQRPI